VPYLSTSAVVIHYEEALYQVYEPLRLPYYESNNHLLIYQFTSPLTTRCCPR